MSRSLDPFHVYRQRISVIKARAPLVAGVWAAAAPLFLLAVYVPPALVLPVYGLLAIALAAIIVAFAHIFDARWDAEGLTAWDVAGGIALIGFAACIFSRADQIIDLIDRGAMTR